MYQRFVTFISAPLTISQRLNISDSQPVSWNYRSLSDEKGNIFKKLKQVQLPPSNTFGKNLDDLESLQTFHYTKRQLFTESMLCILHENIQSLFSSSNWILETFIN